MINGLYGLIELFGGLENNYHESSISKTSGTKSKKVDEET
jgi:hypothetical protein